MQQFPGHDEMTERLIRAGLQQNGRPPQQQQVQVMQIPLLWDGTGETVNALTSGLPQSLMIPVGAPLPLMGDHLVLPDLPELVVTGRQFGPEGLKMLVRRVRAPVRGKGSA